MLKNTIFAASVMLLAAGFVTPAAFADDAGEIKYRKAVMKAVGGHMGGIVGILKGSTGNASNLQVHTDGMLALAKITPSLFPEGSDFGDTTVLPDAWDNPKAFAAVLKQFETAAAAMAVAGKSGDMAKVGTALGGLGKACKACHSTYREKKAPR